MYDCIIIGTGPAGLSAALNLKIYKKNFVWFGSGNLSEKVVKAEKIANYPGIPMATGTELFEKFREHISTAGLEITEKTVTTVMDAGNYYMVLADNEMYEAKTLILCMGVMSTRALEGEDEFLGRGVSYCATCDGMFYRGKKIAVVCNDPKYEHEVEYLADLAAGVTFFPSYKNPQIEHANVTISKDTPLAVNGAMKVSSLTLKSGAVLEVDGVFCLRNAIAPAKLVPGLAVEGGHIKVNRQMETNLTGCFAAGDCTGRPYQYTKAVGEGNVAAHSCIAYLSAHKDTQKKESPSMDEWMKEAKKSEQAAQCGMFLIHNGVVRRTAKAKVRDGLETADVTGMDFSYVEEKVEEAIRETYQMDGIYYIRTWLNEGHLEVGDDIMYVLVGGDIRPHVTDALQYLVGKIKNECVAEMER